MRRGSGAVVFASGGGGSSVVAEIGGAITIVPAASALNATVGAADGRISCCGGRTCVLPCEWQGGGTLAGGSTRQRAKHWALASASAIARRIKALAQAQRMRLQISMHSLQ